MRPRLLVMAVVAASSFLSMASDANAQGIFRRMFGRDNASCGSSASASCGASQAASNCSASLAYQTSCGAAAANCGASLASSCSNASQGDCGASASFLSACETASPTYLYSTPAAVSVAAVPSVQTVSTQSTVLRISNKQRQFRQVLLEQAETADNITRGQLIALKFMVSPLNPKASQNIAMLESLLLEEAQATGQVDPGVQAIDWSGLAGFIKEMLPIILELIKLFG